MFHVNILKYLVDIWNISTSFIWNVYIYMCIYMLVYSYEYLDTVMMPQNIPR